MRFLVACLLACCVACSEPAKENANVPPTNKAVSNESNVSTKPAAPVQEQKMFSKGQVVEDLTFMFETMEAVHPDLYFDTLKEEVNERIAALEKELVGPYTDLEVWKMAAPVVASLGDGHVRLDLPKRFYAKESKAFQDRLFPDHIRFVGEHCFVKNRYPSVEDGLPARARITAINDIEIGQIKKELAQHVSGERTAFRLKRVERQFSRLLYAVYGMLDRFELTIVEGEEKKTVVRLAEAVVGHDPVKRPRLEWREFAAEKAGYLKIGTLQSPKDKFKTFVLEGLAKLREKGLTSLIVDIRGNFGGSSGLGDYLLGGLTDKPFEQYLECRVKVSAQAPLRGLDAAIGQVVPCPQRSKKKGARPKADPDTERLRFEGKSYFLIDSGTYSSARGIAAAVKNFELGTLVGEPTGGLAISYGHMQKFHTPHTGLKFTSSLKHWTTVSKAKPGQGVLPDIEVAQSPDDYLSDSDTALSRTLSIIEEKHRR